MATSNVDIPWVPLEDWCRLHAVKTSEYLAHLHKCPWDGCERVDGITMIRRDCADAWLRAQNAPSTVPPETLPTSKMPDNETIDWLTAAQVTELTGIPSNRVAQAWRSTGEDAALVRFYGPNGGMRKYAYSWLPAAQAFWEKRLARAANAQKVPRPTTPDSARRPRMPNGRLVDPSRTAKMARDFLEANGVTSTVLSIAAGLPDSYVSTLITRRHKTQGENYLAKVREAIRSYPWKDDNTGPAQDIATTDGGQPTPTSEVTRIIAISAPDTINGFLRAELMDVFGVSGKDFNMHADAVRTEKNTFRRGSRIFYTEAFAVALRERAAAHAAAREAHSPPQTVEPEAQEQPRKGFWKRLAGR